MDIKKLYKIYPCILIPCLLSGCPGGSSSKKGSSYHPTYYNYTPTPSPSVPINYGYQNPYNSNLDFEKFADYPYKGKFADYQDEYNRKKYQDNLQQNARRIPAELEDLQNHPITTNSPYLKKYSEDFENCFIANIDSRTNKKEWCVLKADNKQYLIKKFDPYVPTNYPKESILADFVGSFILSQIDSSSAPINYLVVDENGVLMGLASQKIENFTTRNNKFKQVLQDNLRANRDCLCPSLLPQFCDKLKELITSLCYSDKVVKANILANFVNQIDYHHNNVGFITDEQGNIVSSALVDFSWALNLHDKNAIKRLVPAKYFGQLDAVIETFHLIQTNFKVDTLDDIDEVFAQLNEKETLRNIKSLMMHKLKEVELQRQIAILVKNIVANDQLDLKDEDFQKLKDNVNLLTNFGLYNGENTLINFLCDKEEPQNIEYLIALLDKNQDLISSCVLYCLDQGKGAVLENLTIKLDLANAKLLVQNAIKASKTIEHLQLVLTLLGKLQAREVNNPEYAKGYVLIEEAIPVIQDPSRNPSFGELLINEFYSRSVVRGEHRFGAHDFYDYVIYKLIKLWLSQENHDHIAPIPETSVCRSHECSFLGFCYGDAATVSIFDELLTENNIAGMRNWFFWVNNSVMSGIKLYTLAIEDHNADLLRQILSGYNETELKFVVEGLSSSDQKVLLDMLASP